jgi:hypothetical protein
MASQSVSTLKQEEQPAATVIGWQGIRCVLPPDWNLVSFSLERDSGYLRVDAPADSALTVQIRWLDAGHTQEPNSIYGYLMRFLQKRGRSNPRSTAGPDLKASLEKLLKETEKHARKEHVRFECHLKPEHIEGERRAINFSWVGGGRGQGKIWHCTQCNRVVMAQVAGLTKDHAAIASVAAKLFGTLQDHSIDGRDLWALYDLQIEVPNTFRLKEQQLYSGHLKLVFGRSGERLVVERWGLASTTLKRFTLDEWFRNQALIGLKNRQSGPLELPMGHEAVFYRFQLPIWNRIGALKSAMGKPSCAATHYAGGGWVCEATNRIYILQLFYNKRADEDLWHEVASRCRCHS